MGRVTRGSMRLAFGGLLILYCALSLRHLDRTPPVHEDEPWIASVAWKVASEGTFGSDLFRGYYDIDTCYIGFPPLFPLLLAPSYLLSPPGVLQGRILNAALGLLILLLTWLVGRRIVGEGPGTLAVLLLM